MTAITKAARDSLDPIIRKLAEKRRDGLTDKDLLLHEAGSLAEGLQIEADQHRLILAVERSEDYPLPTLEQDIKAISSYLAPTAATGALKTEADKRQAISGYCFMHGITLTDSEQQQALEALEQAAAERIAQTPESYPLKPTGEAGRYMLESAASLQKRDLPPITFYVDQLLPQGIGWLAGVPKVGKSYLALQMAYSIATGADFLGRKTTPSAVIYYSLEMGDQLLQARLSSMYDFNKWPKSLYIGYKLPTFENGLMQQLRADANNTGAKVLIIDNFAWVTSPKSSQDQYSQSYQELAAYKDLADDLDLCICLVHHFNKGTGVIDELDIMSRLMGSTANRGATDFNIALMKNPDNKLQNRLFVESRKAEGADLLLERVGCLSACVGSVEDQNDREKLLAYYADPLVETIHQLLMNRAKITIRPGELIEQMPSYAKKGLTAAKLGKQIAALIPKLKRHDRITLDNESRDSSGTYYTISRPYTEWHSHYAGRTTEIVPSTFEPIQRP